MDKKTDILLRQSQELMTLRERSTSNITSSSNAFLTFLGLVSAALALFIKETGLDDFSFPKLIILISVGLALLFYGRHIYLHIWSFYMNQIFYTRMLNLTRAYLSKRQNMSQRILLETNGNTPGFNEQGVLKEKFSTFGVVCWIKWTNILVMFWLSFAFSMLFVPGIPFINASCKNIAPWIVASIGAGIVFILHECYENKIQKKAIDEWNIRIENKELGW